MACCSLGSASRSVAVIEGEERRVEGKCGVIGWGSLNVFGN